MFDHLRENFELILIVLFLISAIAYAIYRATFARQVKADIVANRARLNAMPKKERKQVRHNILTQHLNSPLRRLIYFFADLFWVLLFVVVARSFIFEPFIIPSGSMKPGLQIGDIVLVNKSELGLRLPVTNARLTGGKAIQRGDVLVFKYPSDPKVSYIKRVIGLPSDKVYYDNRHLTINGQSVQLKKIHTETDMVKAHGNQGIVQKQTSFTVFEETLPPNHRNTIRYANHFSADYTPREWTVPEGKYFMMGDNRDDSADGRAFGFLDDSLIIGKANRIVFNFDCLKGDGKCDRFFKKIQ